MSDKEEKTTWDIKQLRLCIGYDRFITFEIFDDDSFNIYEGDDKAGTVDGKWFYEEIDIDAARRLRDFLNYSVPDK